jgi:hypothetical protein
VRGPFTLLSILNIFSVYTLDIKRKDRLKILSAFHILIALIFLFDLSHTHMDGKKDWIFSAVYFISGIFLLIVGIFNKKFLTSLSKHLALLLFEFMLIISGAIYYWSKGASLVAVSHALLAGAIVLFWIYLKKRENGEKIIISEIDIILPGLAGDRIIEWNQLANVIKKHDLLTIDFKNNKLLQVQVINTDHIDEDEFNQFCQQQLKEKFKS